MPASSSSSSSFSWDNSGAELAQQRGDELSKLQSGYGGSLVGGDVMAALAQKKRIQHLQGYINAYKYGGGSGPYPEVYAGKRAGGSSSSSSMSGGGGGD